MAMLSNCCNVIALPESDRCSKCKDHAVFYDDTLLFIDDLVTNREYRLKTVYTISDDGYDTVDFPIGLILIYKKKKMSGKSGWLYFETRDGIKVEIWIDGEEQLTQIEEIS
jgi:hypothetical protein